MYSLDINLLRERSEYQTETQGNFTSSGNSFAPRKHGKVPIYIGAGVAALTMLATGGGWILVGQQTTQLEAKQKDLDQKLGSLKAQDARLAQLNAQLAQSNEETQAFASVFNQIQPWSAVLQDLRESIPQGVQIASIVQSDLKGAAPTPAAAPAATPKEGGLVAKVSTPPNPEAKPTPGATPAPAAAPVAAAPAPGGTTAGTIPAEVATAKLDISGTAKSFDEVNNFILTLKQSSFFNPEETQLLSAGLVAGSPITQLESKNKIENDLDKTPKKLELPKVVEYKIQTSLKRIPSSELIRELERKGAVGLVTRLKSLQQQQVIKP
jgi:type IV pilus assembly protein PilN